MNPHIKDSIGSHLGQAVEAAYEEAVVLYTEVCDLYRQTPNRPLLEVNALIVTQITLMEIGDRAQRIAAKYSGYEALAEFVQEQDEHITRATRVLFEAPSAGPSLTVDRTELAHATKLAANLVSLLGIVLAGPTPAPAVLSIDQAPKIDPDAPFGGGTDYSERN